MGTSLYFELESYDRYHRADWEDRLAGWFGASTNRDIIRADRPDDAEFIIEPQSWQSFLNGRVFRLDPRTHYRRRPDTTFVWDTGDSPTGRLPGLYCSLSRRLATPARHRSFCYPLRMNRLVQECPQADARYLFGFSGNITSPLRARLFAALQPAQADGSALLRMTESLFHRIYSPETDTERNRYVDDLRQSRFILCPRGNGLSSIRLFETLEAGRVPVILSDALLLPACVDWSACAIFIKESELSRIPAILAERAADWPALATRARAEWERCFGNPTLLSMLVSQIRAIVASRTLPEKYRRYFLPLHLLPGFSVAQAKALVRALSRK